MTLKPRHSITHGLPVAVAALGEGQTTSEIEIMPGSAFTLSGLGDFAVEDPEAVIEASMALANEGRGIFIDFDHGSKIKSNLERRTAAAGWITGLRHDPARDRIMATVDWTPAGRDAVAGRVYRSISPTFAYLNSGEVMAITGAGLTNTPALPQLEALAAQYQEDDMKKLWEQIAEALGLDAGKGEEAICAAALDAIGKTADAGKLLKAAGIDGAVDDAKLEAFAAKLVKGGEAPDPTKYVPKAAFDRVSGRVDALEAAAAKRDADELVEEAKAAGKIVPEMLEWAEAYAAKDPDGFKTWAETSAAIVPVGKQLTGGKPKAKDDNGLSAAEEAICAATGQSTEQFIAARKAKRRPVEA